MSVQQYLLNCIILLNTCSLIVLIDATISAVDNMGTLVIDSSLGTDNLGQILVDTCCKTIKFESNDASFWNKTYNSKAFEFGKLGPDQSGNESSSSDANNIDGNTTPGTTPSTDNTNLPQENNTFGDLLGYPFGPISRLDNDHVEYDNHHGSRIKLINNATYQNENTTKKIWAIYDMTTVHLKIIEILGSNYNECPKCEPHMQCGVGEWKELNARVYTDDGKTESINDLTVKCIEKSSGKTKSPLPHPPIQTKPNPTNNENPTGGKTTKKLAHPTRDNEEKNTGYPCKQNCYTGTGIFMLFVIAKMFVN